MQDVDLHLPPIVEMPASDSKSSCHLDLGHGWPTFPDTTAASHRHRGSTVDEVHDKGSNVASEQEPEECCASLEFSASLYLVMRAVGKAVCGSVCVVVAAMDLELGSQNNTSEEGEEHSKDVHNS